MLVLPTLYDQAVTISGDVCIERIRCWAISKRAMRSNNVARDPLRLLATFFEASLRSFASNAGSLPSQPGNISLCPRSAESFKRFKRRYTRFGARGAWRLYVVFPI